MDSKKIVENLIKKLRNSDHPVEGETIDIKGIWYEETGKENWKDEFAKDVCAMANNWKGKSGYLVFGLKERPNFINGANIELDESNLQQIIGSKVTPVPNITLKNVRIEDSNIYVLKVEGQLTDLPYFAEKFDSSHYIFIRSGSSTNLCRKEDLDRILKAKRDNKISLEVEAYAISKIADFKFKFMNEDLDEFLNLLHKLNQYTGNYSLKVQREVLSCVYEAESRLRLKPCVEITEKLAEVARNALYPMHQKFKTNHKISNQKLKLIKDGINLSHQVCYRGIDKQKFPRVLGSGIGILRIILRFAHLNQLRGIKKEAINQFESLRKAAMKSEFHDAVRWIQFQKDDALALDNDKLPDYPSNLSKKFGI